MRGAALSSVKCLGHLDEGFAAGIALPEDDYNKSLIDEVKRSSGTRVTRVPEPPRTYV